LIASLVGRVGFAMLPLGLVLFATGQLDSTVEAGGLVAAFGVASAAAPLRGRVVDRAGSRALVAFAVACALGLVGLYAAGVHGAAAPPLLALAAFTGAMTPPLGPFTRAIWGTALHDREDRRHRVFALDSAGEESALIVAPLIVGAIVALGSAGGALLVAAGGLLLGTTATAASSLAAAVPRAGAGRAPAARSRLPLALWLVIASLLGPGATLGTINVAVPALAAHTGAAATAGLLLAALAIGTAGASLLAGRRDWRRPATQRLVALQLGLAVTLALAAIAAERPLLVGVVLVLAGMTVGAMFVTLYVLADVLSPQGTGTRTFAWLVTANNGGLALGAAVAGALVASHGSAAGLWLGAACAAAGAALAAAASRAMSA